MNKAGWQAIAQAEDAAYRSTTEFRRLSVEPDWSRELKVVNGGRSGLEWELNCQRCVAAHELRMRGFDVIARASSVMFDRLLAPESWLSAFEGAEVEEVGGENLAEVVSKVRALLESYGGGARAAIWFRVKRHPRAWHVIVAEYSAGEVRFGDPQYDREGAERCFKKAELSGAKLARLDGLELTEEVRRCCENWKR